MPRSEQLIWRPQCNPGVDNCFVCMRVLEHVASPLRARKASILADEGLPGLIHISLILYTCSINRMHELLAVGAVD